MTSEASVRHRARILAVQALYSMEMGDASAAHAVRAAAGLGEETDAIVEAPEMPYAERLVEDVERQKISIDQLVGRSGTRWRVDRMSPLDLQILRVAVAELLEPAEELPTPVVIDEAIEVARAFGGDASSGFVNGVLDAVAREVRRPGGGGGGEGRQG